MVEPIVTSIDEDFMKKSKMFGSKGIFVSVGIDRLVTQGTHLLKSSIELLDDMNDVKSELDQTFDMLSQDLKLIENYLNAWMRLKYFKLEVLVENRVIPTRKKYIEYREAMKHRK